MERRTKEIIAYLILSVHILFHLINTYIWLKMDQSYLKLDAWGHYRYSLAVYEALKNILNFDFKLFLNTVEPLNWYGILVGFVTAPFYFIFGSSQDTAIMINSSIFLLILVFSAFGIGKRLFNKQAGIFSVFILTSYPIVFNNLRTYMLDLPLTSMVSLSLYLLLASDNFSNRKNSLLFALTLILGSLVKLNYLAFMAGPLAITFYRANKQKTFISNSTLRNTSYLIISAAFLGTIFYLVKPKDMLRHIYATSYMELFKNYDFTPSGFFAWKLSWLLDYVRESISQGISFLFLTIFILGFVFFIRLKLKDRWLLYLTVLIPLFMQIFLFSIYPGCMVRYNLPFLPVIAIISSVGLLNMKPKILKMFFLPLVVPLAIIQFFAVSYGINFLPKEIGFSFDIIKPDPFTLVIFKQNVEVNPFLEDKTSHPSYADWKSVEVLKTIINSNTSGKIIQVVSLSNVPELIEVMEYQILKERLPIFLTPAFSASVEEFLQKSYPPLDLACQSADYIIICNNNDSVWEEGLNITRAAKEKIAKARKIFYENIGHFGLVKKFRLPDNTDLFIYRNTYKTQLTKMEQIKRGDIRLIFDSGRVRIFFNDIEITKGLGLYASLFSQQHWHDSMEACWEAKRISETKLTATGKWMYIPITQIWEIGLKEGNVIYWRVKSIADDVIKIEMEDYKLMLSDKYRVWFTSNGQTGKFADYFEKNLWKKFWEGDIKKKVGVRPNDTVHIHLPTVRFNADRMSSEYFTSIENSDQLFNGRVIGCFKKNGGRTNLFSPDKDKYFSAEISID